MPAHRKRPAPPTRMVELLLLEKVTLLEAGGVLSDAAFEVAWERSWQVMVSERAWPHATRERRGWRQAMEQAMKPEARACFLGLPTGYSRFQAALAEALDKGRAVTDDLVLGQLVA